MIWGFGDTEKREAKRFANLIVASYDPDFDTFEANVRKLVKEQVAICEKNDALSRQDAPQRYTRPFVFVYKSLTRHIVECTFHHINRQHPFSDDGWAMLKTEWLVVIPSTGCDWNEPKIYQEA